MGPTNLTPTGVRAPDRTARIESLYLLHHPGRHELSLIIQNCRVLESGNRTAPLPATSLSIHCSSIHSPVTSHIALLNKHETSEEPG